MTTSTEAIYEKGFLRLLTPVALSEGERVQVMLVTIEATTDLSLPLEIMESIAALPEPEGVEPFSGRDHDRILYGINHGA